MGIEAIVVDSREPEWVQKLTFNGIPTMVQYMEHGDLMAACDDGSLILVERKTPDDFLNSLKDGRLFPQLAPLYYASKWSYLMITGELQRGMGDHVVTDRGLTGWSWTAVQGAILSIQEMGIMVVQCAGDSDYEDAIIRLGKRDRKNEVVLQPARFPRILNVQEQIIASLPGIGIERLSAVMEFSQNNPATALWLLTDPDVQIPNFPNATKKRIRMALGLQDKTYLVPTTNDQGQEYIAIEKVYEEA